MIVQVPPATTVDPHGVVPEFTTVKLLALVPESVMPEIVSAALPVLVSVVLSDVVAFNATDPNASGDGLNDTVVVGAVPVPVSATPCGLPSALSATLNSALKLPAPLGVNVSITVQFAPAARELVQVLPEIAKLLAFVPVIPMLEIASVELPVLEIVSVIGLEVTPLVALGNVSDAGENETTGEAAVPVELPEQPTISATNEKDTKSPEICRREVTL